MNGYMRPVAVANESPMLVVTEDTLAMAMHGCRMCLF